MSQTLSRRHAGEFFNDDFGDVVCGCYEFTTDGFSIATAGLRGVGRSELLRVHERGEGGSSRRESEAVLHRTSRPSEIAAAARSTSRRRIVRSQKRVSPPV